MIRLILQWQDQIGISRNSLIINYFRNSSIFQSIFKPDLLNLENLILVDKSYVYKDSYRSKLALSLHLI